MGLNNRREELPSPDDDAKRDPKARKEADRRAASVGALPDTLRRSLIEKLNWPLVFPPHQSWADLGDEEGFQILLSFLLRMSHPAYSLSRLRICDSGRVLGKVHESGRDIALPEALEPFVGLCSIDLLW